MSDINNRAADSFGQYLCVDCTNLDTKFFRPTYYQNFEVYRVVHQVVHYILLISNLELHFSTAAGVRSVREVLFVFF